MREVILADGKKAKIRLFHCELKHPEDGTPRRGTELHLSVGRRTFKVKAYCHPKDNFCRKTGRKRVAAHLLARCRTDRYLAFALNKADRKAVFLAICPEYADKAWSRAKPLRPTPKTLASVTSKR